MIRVACAGAKTNAYETIAYPDSRADDIHDCLRKSVHSDAGFRSSSNLGAAIASDSHTAIATTKQMPIQSLGQSYRPERSNQPRRNH